MTSAPTTSELEDQKNVYEKEQGQSNWQESLDLNDPTLERLVRPI